MTGFGHALQYVHPFRTEDLTMSRIFAYCRVSTLEQTTENQRRETGGGEQLKLLATSSLQKTHKLA